MGRNRKPTEVKQLNGTYREDQEVNPDPVQLVPVDLPAPPALIAQDMTDYARAVWAMVEPGLAGAGLLTNENMFQLVRYCRLMDEWRLVHNRIDEITAGAGTPFQNQRLLENIKAGKALHDQIMEIDRTFGITPLFADGIKNRITEQETDLDKLMKE